MDGEVTMHPGTAARRKVVPRVLLSHPFVTLLIVGALVGGGLRFVPSTSAAAGSSGQTACAAK